MITNLRSRLLKEVPVIDEELIYETLQELRVLFPSYRDDQLFVFWLARLKQQGVDIDNFASEVSFT